MAYRVGKSALFDILTSYCWTNTQSFREGSSSTNKRYQKWPSASVQSAVTLNARSRVSRLTRAHCDLARGSTMAKVRVGPGSIGEFSRWRYIFGPRYRAYVFIFSMFEICSDKCLERGCVTPVQIASLKMATDGDLEMLDGYDDLPSDFQGKIGQAFEDGHVADDDWRGVISPH